ncbi:MAG: short-chain dehydrogenase/reductase [Armatimonadetes bacterium]|jgi:2-keto-3-deoxy-L-fuconate dehydrogenase|nr:short-chain dehydrogenase/reductase [Armatimonadota bacterium]
MRLKDKVVIITGAGAGIGRASSVLFAREGARVVCSDLDAATGEESSRLAREAGAESFFVQGNAAETADVERLVRETTDRFGGLNVFYANAGVVPGGTVTECTDDEWDRAMAINARSVYLACKYSIPVMLAAGGGTIVCTASVAGMVGVKNRAVYSASKAAVTGLVKSVALDYIQDGIRINSICPGTVDTPSLHGRLQATGNYEEALKQFIARQPMGRIGKADEIAALALYLASDESGYMTGQNLMIDGGLSL